MNRNLPLTLCSRSRRAGSGNRLRSRGATRSAPRRYAPAPNLPDVLNLLTANRDLRTVPSLPNPLRYVDVLLVVLAAPIMLLIGVPAGGYLIAMSAWIVLRAVGVAVEHAAAGSGNPSREISLRLGFLLGRLFLLALTVILVRRGEGRDAGLAALAVIVFAFTVELAVSAATRPRRR
jgi:hypothetical protein